MPSASPKKLDKKPSGTAPPQPSYAQSSAASNNAFGGPEVSSEFREWCKEQMYTLNNKSKDLTLIEFLLSLNSKDEVWDYAYQYLGRRPEVTQFIETFLQRKVFEADSFTSGGNSGAFEDKKGKKKAKKGAKLTAELLGFSVESNRIMQGEIVTEY
eukprot:TRINITY_DN18612_c0_g1::TRINITY_DN18612_c0_g1_i1::g.1186::m.1186 TRINITY_DN18612_c0_g1::TRINITY_DN18612_c0_g1_i1::g.1186  ORF type:complete len:182 (+),score=64.40,sp/Q5U236/GGYF2_XENLA/32.62/2e-09 TRINITY_DN18612_c0_g1_i1:79-546(+)